MCMLLVSSAGELSFACVCCRLLGTEVRVGCFYSGNLI